MVSLALAPILFWWYVYYQARLTCYEFARPAGTAIMIAFWSPL